MQRLMKVHRERRGADEMHVEGSALPADHLAGEDEREVMRAHDLLDVRGRVAADARHLVDELVDRLRRAHPLEAGALVETGARRDALAPSDTDQEDTP
jgi:hypothetical protein